MDIGKRLKLLWVRYGKPQKELADYLGVKINTYSQYENNKRDPGLELIGKICEYYEISPSVFFDDLNVDKPEMNMPLSKLIVMYEIKHSEFESIIMRLSAQKSTDNIQSKLFNNKKINDQEYQDFFVSAFKLRHEIKIIIEMISIKLKLNEESDESLLNKITTIINKWTIIKLEKEN